MELVQTITLTADGSVTFSNIPQDAAHLLFLTEVRGSPNSGDIRIRVNGSASSVYSYIYIKGYTGNAEDSGTATNQTQLNFDFGANDGGTATGATGRIMFFNYSDSTPTEGLAITNYMDAITDLERGAANNAFYVNLSAAITSIQFYGVGTLYTDTTISMYKIKA